jgi:dTDP-glucose 4,6-dehydratase
MGVEFQDAVDIVEDRASTDAAYLMDCSKMERAFGWRAAISLDQGIQECIKWVDRDFDRIKTHPLDYVHQP